MGTDILKKISLIAVLLLLGRCSSIPNYPTPPLWGFFYTNINFTQRNSKFSSLGDGKILKFGKSCTWSLAYVDYYVLETGGGSIQLAAKNGGITKIASIDRQFKYIFFATEECIVVWGE